MAGAGHVRVLLRHVVPNVAYLVIVTASLRVGAFVLAEASLSCLSFGVKPLMPSWGQMLTVAAHNFMVFRPELAIFLGLAITLVVFGFNVLGDALRDVTAMVVLTSSRGQAAGWRTLAAGARRTSLMPNARSGPAQRGWARGPYRCATCRAVSP